MYVSMCIYDNLIWFDIIHIIQCNTILLGHIVYHIFVQINPNLCFFVGKVTNSCWSIHFPTLVGWITILGLIPSFRHGCLLKCGAPKLWVSILKWSNFGRGTPHFRTPYFFRHLQVFLAIICAALPISLHPAMQIMCISRWTAFCSFKPSHGVDGFTTIQRWRRNASLRVNSERWVWRLICLARPRYDGGQWVMSDCLLCPKALWALSKNGLQITNKIGKHGKQKQVGKPLSTWSQCLGSWDVQIKAWSCWRLWCWKCSSTPTRTIVPWWR